MIGSDDPGYELAALHDQVAELWDIVNGLRVLIADDAAAGDVPALAERVAALEVSVQALGELHATFSDMLAPTGTGADLMTRAETLRAIEQAGWSVRA